MFVTHDRFRRRRSALAGLLAATCLGLAAVAAGPDAYDPAVAYKAGALVVGSDGNTYRAIANVKGSDPATASHEAWRLAYVATELVLDVPGRFKTIADAWKFLDGCRIAESAKVIILVAPGRHEHAEPLVLNHSEGARILIRGVGENPENCTLVFSDDDGDQADGVVVNGSNPLTLENLTIKSLNESGQGIGVLVDHRSAVTLTRVAVDNFSIVAGGNSQLTATDCKITMSRAGDGFHVRNGSHALLTNCTAITKRRKPGMYGFHAYNGSTLYCVGCRAEGWDGGFKAYTNSAMHLERCTGRDLGYGASAWFSSSVNAIDCTFADCSQGGIGAIFATASIIDCTLTNNEVGLVVVGNAFAQFLDKPSTITGGKFGIRALSGGRVDFSQSPRFVNVPEKFSVFDRPGDLTVEEAVGGQR